MEEKPTRPKWALAILNLALFAICFLFGVLVRNDPPISDLEATQHAHTGDLLLFVSMFFWIGFCVTAPRD